MILARAEDQHRVVREPDLAVARVLIPALPLLEPELASGCIAMFRSGRLRVRRLPISG